MEMSAAFAAGRFHRTRDRGAGGASARPVAMSLEVSRHAPLYTLRKTG